VNRADNSADRASMDRLGEGKLLASSASENPESRYGWMSLRGGVLHFFRCCRYPRRLCRTRRGAITVAAV
jgi:hypothetical protein